MNSNRFDRLTKRLAYGVSRRSVLQGLAGAGTVAALGSTSTFAQNATPEASPAANESLNWLVTLDFSGAMIAPVENELGPQGMLEVTLTGVESNAVAFTDRPARLSAEWSVDQVVDVIESARTAKDPVNANLSARLPDSLQSVGIVLTVGPTTWESVSSTITFRAYPLGVAAGDLPSKLRRGYLFIDNVQAQGLGSGCFANGHKCGDPSDCCSFYCPGGMNGTCTAPLPPGSPCNPNIAGQCGVQNEEKNIYACCSCESYAGSTACTCADDLDDCW